MLFAVGPLTGWLPGDDRYAAVTKSPQTGGFLDTYGGGSFPGRLAGALDGHQLLLVTGAADEPVRIVVEAGEARIEPADDWWGLDAVELGSRASGASVAGIGPAGERRVTYATIASDGGDHHAGRGGAGAVMGAKRLKAVVARGEPAALPTALEPLRERAEARYAASGPGRWHRSGGTAESVDFADAVGGLATRGWRSGRFEGAEGVGVEAVRGQAATRERDGEDVPGDFRIGLGEKLHRGAAGMTLGAGLGIDDADAVARLEATCDRLGIDLVSGGNVLAWLVRAGEAGHLDAPLTFGDPDGAERALEAIAGRETPLADALADGVQAAAARFGGEGLVPSVKGLELPNYDPRAAPSMALAYATSDRGACHRRARPIEREPFDAEWSPAEAAEAVIDEQHRRAASWCLIADDFVDAGLGEEAAEWLAAIGHPADEAALDSLGERVWTLTRLFNRREGWGRADDALPAALTEPTEDDGRAVDPDRFEAMLDAYYDRRGWDAEGRPRRALLDRLGMADLVEDSSSIDGATPRPAED
ncbi:MAG: aldehyde ferredoxin oxidoreductase C-terminal domain-containing protein [Halobacteriales archaeon]|nr:aldehyde ferredoxin oxidoreductase C-terminal domain-containing protein [Halobacteriales archaeon]